MDRKTFLYLTGGALLFPKKLLSQTKENNPPQGRAEKNDSYLVRNLLLDQKTFKKFSEKNISQTIKNLGKKLESLEKPTYTPYYLGMQQNGPEDLYKINLGQLIRIYLVMETLENPYFRKQISNNIQEDLQDLQTEGLGLIRYDYGRVNLLPLDSATKNLKETNLDASIFDYISAYPLGSLDTIQHIFSYHNHAHANEKQPPRGLGPSFGTNKKTGRVEEDIGISFHTIKKYGQDHNILFSLWKENEHEYTINTCYYGGILNKDNNPLITILNLGNWKTEK